MNHNPEAFYPKFFEFKEMIINKVPNALKRLSHMVGEIHDQDSLYKVKSGMRDLINYILSELEEVISEKTSS